MLLTRIHNLDGPLSKSLTLEDGKLVKTAAADLVNGIAYRIHVADIEHFAKVVCRLTSQEALTFGVPAFEHGLITTQEHVAGGRAPQGSVPRDRAHFSWSDGRGCPMLDIDAPKDGSEPFTSTGFDGLLCDILPWWRGVARFYRPSVSAFVYTEDGRQLSGRGSLRCYAICDKAENIPFVGVAIADALWKAGYGRIEFGKAGQALVRCPVDTAVWQPERLDFAGAAVLGAGLVQKRFPPIVIDGKAIDTEAVIAAGPGKVAVGVWASNSTEVRKAKHAARPEERTRRRAYIKQRVEEDVAAGFEEAMARRKWRAALEERVLEGSFELHFRDKGTVTVSEVLRDPGRFNFERLADPNEPDYASDPRIAQFYANEGQGRPHIYSHAHGGCKYVLTGAPEILSVASNSSETSKPKEADTATKGHRHARN